MKGFQVILTAKKRRLARGAGTLHERDDIKASAVRTGRSAKHPHSCKWFRGQYRTLEQYSCLEACVRVVDVSC